MHSYYVCAECREINKPCNHETIRVGSNWSAPRKTNDKAWKLIASGDIWWNKRRIDRPLRQRKVKVVHHTNPETKSRVERMREQMRLYWIEHHGKPNSRTNRRFRTKVSK